MKRKASPRTRSAELWNGDDELFAIAQRELFTCVVGDAMDKMGLQHQFLPPQIQPLSRDMVVIGRAMPVLSVDVFEEKIVGSANKLMEKPFGLMLEALDVVNGHAAREQRHAFLRAETFLIHFRIDSEGAEAEDHEAAGDGDDEG